MNVEITDGFGGSAPVPHHHYVERASTLASNKNKHGFEDLGGNLVGEKHKCKN